MPDNRHKPEPPLSPEQLDLLLDGQLSGEAIREVESAIQHDAVAQQMVSKQAKIDGALKNHFQPPSVDRSVWLALAEEVANEPALAAEKTSVEQAKPPVSIDRRSSAQRQWKMALAVAASLACIALWGTRWEKIASLWQTPQGGYGQITVAQVYKTAVDNGFTPDWFCEDERLFAETFEQRQGQGLLLKPLPDGVRMAGLAYLEGFTPMATSMLAYVGERPVLVLAAKTKRINKEQLESTAEIAVFRSELGDLTLVEVLPADLSLSGAPRLLPYFYSADVPKQPTGRVPGSR